MLFFRNILFILGDCSISIIFYSMNNHNHLGYLGHILGYLGNILGSTETFWILISGGRFHECKSFLASTPRKCLCRHLRIVLRARWGGRSLDNCEIVQCILVYERTLRFISSYFVVQYPQKKRDNNRISFLTHLKSPRTIIIINNLEIQKMRWLWAHEATESL